MKVGKYLFGHWPLGSFCIEGTCCKHWGQLNYVTFNSDKLFIPHIISFLPPPKLKCIHKCKSEGEDVKWMSERVTQTLRICEFHHWNSYAAADKWLQFRKLNFEKISIAREEIFWFPSDMLRMHLEDISTQFLDLI